MPSTPGRYLGIQSPVCPGIISGSIDNSCPFKVNPPKRFFLKKRGTANPFNTTDSLITDEAIWDTALASGNIYMSPPVFSAETTPGEANINESPSGQKSVQFYADTILNMILNNLNPSNERALLDTIRGNANALEFIYLNIFGDIVSKEPVTPASDPPTWLPINLATATEKSFAGRVDETNMVSFHLFEEVAAGWYKTQISFDLDSKVQSYS